MTRRLEGVMAPHRPVLAAVPAAAQRDLAKAYLDLEGAIAEAQLAAALARSYVDSKLHEANELLKVPNGDHVGVLLTVEQYELLHYVVAEAWARANALHRQYHGGFADPAAS